MLRRGSSPAPPPCHTRFIKKKKKKSDIFHIHIGHIPRCFPSPHHGRLGSCSYFAAAPRSSCTCSTRPPCCSCFACRPCYFCRTLAHVPRACTSLLLLCRPPCPTTPTGAVSARRGVSPRRGSSLASPLATAAARRRSDADGGGGRTGIRCKLQVYNSNVSDVL
jgi:hypothetical protein